MAALKRLVVAEGEVLGRGLHGVTAVAALKHILAFRARLSCAPSPRRHCRGRIEAPKCGKKNLPTLASPRRHCRGRIEAGCPGSSRTGSAWSSPRRHCRGRIEAPGNGEGKGNGEGLHGVTAVAALKPASAARTPRPRRPRSPRRHCRGRIEAGAPPHRTRPLPSRSPRRHCRGRIEARRA